MTKILAYCFKIRRQSEVIEPKIVQLKNGRKAVRGTAKDAPDCEVFRILGTLEAEQLEKELKR
ncbi:MAG: hypothetical protein FJ312_10180 [SAR202 cluster bacterium]|nr:hypothetical protein [SAR202 cluster bacterium]